MRFDTCHGRREFVKTALAGGFTAVIAGRLVRAAKAAAPAAPAPAPAAGAPVKVALTNGGQRTDNVFRALKSLEKEIAAAIGNRRVVIKPNLVAPGNQLACSHTDGITGILDFLKSINKLDNAIIAESSASQTSIAFENLGYIKLAEKYKVKLVDLDQEKFQTLMAFNETDALPKAVRVSSILANQADNFIISACMPKTHNYALVTMSIKNIILGAGMKFSNASATAPAGGRGGTWGFFSGVSDKPTLHGGGARGININLSMLAPMLHPSLAVIDGYEGMEGNGPGQGTKVDHRICVVSTDYVAADAVGATLMGLSPSDVGYIAYCASANLGVADVSKLEIIGEPVAKLAKKYELPPSAQTQLQWKNPARVSPA